jgi:hypothetical protein
MIRSDWGTMAVVSLLALANAGCASRGGILGVDCCADIPAGAIPEPAGTKVCQWQTAQVNAALSDQTVLYLADFVDHTDQLSPAAVHRVARHVESGLATSLPWVVEPSGDANLDQQRIDRVADHLSQHGISPVSITLATPAAIGLRGPVAEATLGNVVGGRANNVSANPIQFTRPPLFGGAVTGGMF